MVRKNLLWMLAVSMVMGLTVLSCSDDEPGNQGDDGKGTGSDSPKYGVNFTLIDSDQQKYKTSTLVTEDLVGNGEYFTVSGFESIGDKVYTALCPLGFSDYGIESGAAEGYEDLIAEDEETGEKSISATVHPNQVWIGIYDGINNFDKKPTIITDNRISYATSRYRSQFYPTICAADDGYLYVFSNSVAKSQSNEKNKTTLDAGVLRVNTTTNEFDKSYYFNIEDAANATFGKKLSFFQVWHITGTKFLLRMYATEGKYDSTSDAKMMAIFDSQSGTLTKVTDFPVAEELADMGRFVYVENGKAYIPVVFQKSASGSSTVQQPAIYIIDAAAAKATKGATVQADGGITAICKMNNGTLEKYVIAAASSEASYLVPATEAEINDPDAVLTIKVEGGSTETDAATHWLFPNQKYAYGLGYRQGDAGVSYSFELKSDGTLGKRSAEFTMPRFTAFGTRDQYLILGAAAETSL